MQGGIHAWQNDPTEYNNSLKLEYQIQYRVASSGVFGVLLLASSVPKVTSSLPPGDPVTIEFMVTDACDATTTYVRTVGVRSIDTQDEAASVAALDGANADLVASIATQDVSVSLGKTAMLASVFTSATGSTSRGASAGSPSPAVMAAVNSARPNLMNAISAIVSKSATGSKKLSSKEVDTTCELLKLLTSASMLPVAATDVRGVGRGVGNTETTETTKTTETTVTKAKRVAVTIPIESTTNAVAAIEFLANDALANTAAGSSQTSDAAVSNVFEISSNLVGILFVSSTDAASNPAASRRRTAVGYTPAVVQNTIRKIEGVVGTVMSTLTESQLKGVAVGSVEKTSTDGSLSMAASKSTCSSPGSLAQGSSSFAMPDMCRFQSSSRHRRSSDAVTTQGIRYDESPYTWTNQSISTSVTVVMFKDASGKAIEIAGLSQSECVDLTLRSNTYVPAREPFLLLGDFHTLASGVPFGTSINRTKAELVQALHVTVEPFHLMGNNTTPYVPTTVNLVLSVAVGDKTTHFRKKITSVRSEITFRASADVHESRKEHTMQLLPLAWTNVTCRDNSSLLDVQHYLSSLPDDAAIIYQLTVLQTDADSDVRMVMQTAHSTCQYLDISQAVHQWDSRGCVVSPYSSLGTMRCRCSHMTPFGGDVVVKPNTVRYRAITADDIAGNPIVLTLIVIVWLVFIALVIRGRRRDKVCHLSTLGPMQLEQNNPSHTGRYQVTVRTGMRPGSGTTAHVSLQLFGTHGKSRDIRLSHPWRPVFNRQYPLLCLFVICLTWGHGFLCDVLDLGPRFPLHHPVWEHSG